MASKENRKRKFEEKVRYFQEKWSYQYFFIENKNKAICLICNESVAVIKEYNIKRHYDTKHSEKYSGLQGHFRSDKVDELKSKLNCQQSLFLKGNKQSENSVRVSYIIAQKIAKYGKPFTDGHFVKECLQSAIDVLSPSQAQAVSNISLSGATVARRVEDLSANILNSFKLKCKDFAFYSIAVDESTDATDTAQVAIFIRGVDNSFSIVEELAGVVGLKGTTRGSDVYSTLKEVLSKCELTLNNISAITTDGAPSMTGHKAGVVALLKSDAEECGNPKMMAFHCIIHQENLCKKSFSSFEHVMTVVIKVVNFIRSKGLNHRQFQQFLSDLEAQYGDLLYYAEVRWLSRGKMLHRLFSLRDEVQQFMESKGKPLCEFQDEKWIRDFAFLVDITGHLNELNYRLLGKGLLVHNLYDYVKAFETKLILWERQLQNKDPVHFPTLRELVNNGTEWNSEEYVQCISNLRKEFESRFSDFREKEIYMKMFSSPFSVDTESVPAELQLEFVDFQCDSSVKSKFFEIPTLTDFYSKYVSEEKYPQIRKHALFMSSIFGSTYVCEQLFSQMKNVKSKIRTRLTDQHLEDTLRIATTGILPDIEALVKQKQCQVSH